MTGGCQSENRTRSKLSSAGGGTVERSTVTQCEPCHWHKPTFATRAVHLHEYVQQCLLPSVIRESEFKDSAESVFAATARRAIERTCFIYRKTAVRIASVIVAASKTMQNRSGIRAAPAGCRAIERP